MLTWAVVDAAKSVAMNVSRQSTVTMTMRPHPSRRNPVATVVDTRPRIGQRSDEQNDRDVPAEHPLFYAPTVISRALGLPVVFSAG